MVTMTESAQRAILVKICNAVKCRNVIFSSTVQYIILKAECDKYLFLTEYKYQILFGFQKTPNIEY